VQGCNVTVAPWPATSRCSREGIDTWLAPPNGTNARAACSGLEQTEEVFEGIGEMFVSSVSMEWERGRARTVCKGERQFCWGLVLGGKKRSCVSSKRLTQELAFGYFNFTPPMQY